MVDRRVRWTIMDTFCVPTSVKWHHLGDVLRADPIRRGYNNSAADRSEWAALRPTAGFRDCPLLLLLLLFKTFLLLLK